MIYMLQSKKIQFRVLFKPRLHLTEYFPIKYSLLSNHEQSETNRPGNRFCRK